MTEYSTSGPIVGAACSELPLDIDERCLWKGHPPHGLMFRSQDIFQVPFSVAWCGFAIFWEVSVAKTSNAPSFFLLWGAGFVAVGLYFVFGRFIADAMNRARTSYGVTDRRILIVSGITNRRVKSLALQGLSEIELQEKANGRGTITFGPQPGFAGNWGRGWPGGNRYAAPAFENIDGARQVYDLVRRTQQTIAVTQSR
jgi:hypothetical protein